MKLTLLHPGYFGPVDQFCVLVKADRVLWEKEDNYQKQTYRNRQYIYGANGSLMLNIPIKHAHGKEGRQKYKDVQIDNEFNWQKNHWKSLESAYRASPYFEFFEDELHFLYEKRFRFLMDFNRQCTTAMLTCLEVEKNHAETDEYLARYIDSKEVIDDRHLIEAKRSPQIEFNPYSQVFKEKHGFLPNLSILDLLFNEGPQTPAYLKEHARLLG